MPSQVCSLTGAVTVTRLTTPIAHVMTASPAAPVGSVAVMVAVYDAVVPVGVPVMAPVAALILRPGGRPAALKVSFTAGAESVAVTCTGVIAVPTVDFSVAGAVTVIRLPMVHVKSTVSVAPE